MGFVKSFFSRPKPKQAALPPPAPKVEDTGPSASEIAAEQEEEKKRNILAINAQGSRGILTGAGGLQGQGTTAKKRLLGE